MLCLLFLLLCWLCLLCCCRLLLLCRVVCVFVLVVVSCVCFIVNAWFVVLCCLRSLGVLLCCFAVLLLLLFCSRLGDHVCSTVGVLWLFVMLVCYVCVALIGFIGCLLLCVLVFDYLCVSGLPFCLIVVLFVIRLLFYDCRCVLCFSIVLWLFYVGFAFLLFYVCVVSCPCSIRFYRLLVGCISVLLKYMYGCCFVCVCRLFRFLLVLLFILICTA